MNIYGYHSIEERLKLGRISGILKISRENSRIHRLIGLARRIELPVERVSENELTRLAGSENHRGALLVLFEDRGTVKGKTKYRSLKEKLKEIESDNSLVILLDGITDPQNLGSILRSADQFAVDMVILPSRRSAEDGPTVSKVSSGADSYVDMVVAVNLNRAMEELKREGYWVYGADMDGKPIDRVDLRGRVAIVMGSEGRGLHRLVRERCDEIVAIPARGHVDSFNVGVAAGIIMYEVRRQQGFEM